MSGAVWRKSSGLWAMRMRGRGVPSRAVCGSGPGRPEASGRIVGDTGHGQVAAPHRQHHGPVLQQGDAVGAAQAARRAGRNNIHGCPGRRRRPAAPAGRPWGEIPAPQGGAAVHEVAREQDEVRPEGIGPVHHGPGPCGGKVAADVQVREMGHAQAVQGGGQTGQDDLLRADLGDAQGPRARPGPSSPGATSSRTAICRLLPGRAGRPGCRRRASHQTRQAPSRSSESRASRKKSTCGTPVLTRIQRGSSGLKVA